MKELKYLRFRKNILQNILLFKLFFNILKADILRCSLKNLLKVNTGRPEDIVEGF